MPTAIVSGSVQDLDDQVYLHLVETVSTAKAIVTNHAPQFSFEVTGEYNVEVVEQPNGQTCNVYNGDGDVRYDQGVRPAVTILCSHESSERSSQLVYFDGNYDDVIGDQRQQEFLLECNEMDIIIQNDARCDSVAPYSTGKNRRALQNGDYIVVVVSATTAAGLANVVDDFNTGGLDLDSFTALTVTNDAAFGVAENSTNEEDDVFELTLPVLGLAGLCACLLLVILWLCCCKQQTKHIHHYDPSYAGQMEMQSMNLAGRRPTNDPTVIHRGRPLDQDLGQTRPYDDREYRTQPREVDTSRDDPIAARAAKKTKSREPKLIDVNSDSKRFPMQHPHEQKREPRANSYADADYDHQPANEKKRQPSYVQEYGTTGKEEVGGSIAPEQLSDDEGQPGDALDMVAELYKSTPMGPAPGKRAAGPGGELDGEGDGETIKLPGGH